MYFKIVVPLQFKILGKLLPVRLAYFIPSNGMTKYTQIWKTCFIGCISFFLEEAPTVFVFS